MRHVSTSLAAGVAFRRRRSDALVFRALGDPTRRSLLDWLFEREGRTLGELQSEVRGMSRFGVMKHLRVLEAAGLVVTRKIGRERFHYLNPLPVRLIHDRWVSKYSVAALAALKQELEGIAMTDRPTQVYRIFIRATPEQIWEAITKPGFTAKYFYGSSVETDGKTGSPIRRYAPDGATLWSDDNILESDPPRRLVHTWRAMYDPELAAEPPSRVMWEIEPQADGVTRVTVLHDRLEASPRTAENVAGGWMFIISGLKTLLETGMPLTERSTGTGAT